VFVNLKNSSLGGNKQMDFSKIAALLANGQFVAAVAGAADAIAAVLVSSGAIHTAPSAALVTAVCVGAANVALFVLSYIQHTQHTATVEAARNEKMETAYHARALELATIRSGYPIAA
jgi:hypothetical protein